MANDELPPLVVDRAAAAERPSDEAVAEWAAGQRVFVSSVIEGYAEPRQGAVDAIESVGAAPIWFERFGGRDADPNQAYLDEVRSSDVYVGLLGERYGRLLPSRFSATHEEYREAEQHGLRLSVWVETGVEREGPQQSFLDEVRQFNVTGGYGSPDELRRELARRLRDIAAEDLSPWCKLGPIVFRSRTITESRGHVRIEATIKDPLVADALQELGDRFGRRQDYLTYGGRTLLATFDDLEVTTRAARSRDVRLELRVEDVPSPNTYSINGLGWDDQTDLALRVALFGEENPLGVMGGTIDIPNPLPGVVEAGVAAEALRPICELVLTEVLAVQRGVSRVLRLRLGASIAGKRALQLEWQPGRQYGQTQPVRTLRGVVQLP